MNGEGEWVFERSSGYAGWRCTKCETWVYEGHPKNCRCALLERAKPVCGICKSEDVQTQMDVGSDIDPSGEERQHLDTCKKCGAERLWVERFHDFKDYKIHEGKWREKSFRGLRY